MVWGGALNKVIHSGCFLFGSGRCRAEAVGGVRGQLQGDVGCVLWLVAPGAAGPRTDRKPLLSPVTSLWIEMSESGSEVNKASFSLCSEEGGDNEV